VSNLEIIELMLSNSDLFGSELEYEVGLLLNQSYVFLSTASQDNISNIIMQLYTQRFLNEEIPVWVYEYRARFTKAIPCHLRAPHMVEALNEFESKYEQVVLHPSIHLSGGTVRAPFSHDVFLSYSEPNILKLFQYYEVSKQREFRSLIGGKEEVARQLHIASSIKPIHFLSFLEKFWYSIPPAFKDHILSGVSHHLRGRFGNLRDESYEPIESPTSEILIRKILNELERHPNYWQIPQYRISIENQDTFNHQHVVAEVLLACSHGIYTVAEADRIVFFAVGFEYQDDISSISGDSLRLLTKAMNMNTGIVAQALLNITVNLIQRDIPLSRILEATLRRYAQRSSPAIRALFLEQYLQIIQYHAPELGWKLFALTMGEPGGMWRSAERCLYHAYHDDFSRVSPMLDEMRANYANQDLETWGRISALCCLTGHIEFDKLSSDLKSLSSEEAWTGVFSVWACDSNIVQYRHLCLQGIRTGLNTGAIPAQIMNKKIKLLFNRGQKNHVNIPIDVIKKSFELFALEQSNSREILGFPEWLNAISQEDTDLALGALEIYLDFVSATKPYIHDGDGSLPKVLYQLFAQAELNEEVDGGEMLLRVVSAQDKLLSLGITGVSDWLIAAERP
jgi:hypothetical protein